MSAKQVVPETWLSLRRHSHKQTRLTEQQLMISFLKDCSLQRLKNKDEVVRHCTMLPLSLARVANDVIDSVAVGSLEDIRS